MKFFWKKEHQSKNIDYKKLISVLENGIKDEITTYLWQPAKSSVNYLPFTYDLILKLKKPVDSDEILSIHKTFAGSKYELIVFNVTWSTGDIKYSPIIIDRSSGKIVGIMLPFNELLNHLPEKDSEKITKLGVAWVGFVMELK